jgi:outer membrane protein
MKRVWWLAAGLLAAAPSHGADLLSLYKEAQVQDAQYAAAKAQFIAAQERLPQARALMLPNAAFGAGYDFNRQDVEYSGTIGPRSGTESFNTYEYGVTIVQPLYRRENQAIYAQAKIQTDQAETQLDLASQDLLLRVAEAYFNVLLARANLNTIRAQKSAVAQQLEQAKRNFIVGTATITDQREAQANYDLVVAQEIGAVNDLEVTNRALEVLIGRPVEGPLSGLKLPITLNAPEPNDMKAWVEQAYQSSIEVQLSQQNLAIAQREVDRARSGHQPTLDAIGSLRHNYNGASQTAIGLEATAAAIGLQFNIPLYQGGAITSRVREAAALQERVRQDLENARRTVAQRTREAYLGVTSGLAQVNALEQAVSSTQLQLESTRLGQEVGVRTAVDVLDAERQLSQARRNLAQAIYNTILSQLRLKAAVGKLAEADIVSVNSLLREDVP